MKQVVINTCYGGFGLSPEAYFLYAELKGITLYPEVTNSLLTTYFIVPPEQQVNMDNWVTLSQEERIKLNAQYKFQVLYDREIARDDPTLIKTVRELKEKANGRFAKLEIIEIPDNVKWHIEEYDGIEWIAEDHRTWPDQGQ
jgi:hypothetical protein